MKKPSLMSKRTSGGFHSGVIWCPGPPLSTWGSSVRSEASFETSPAETSSKLAPHLKGNSGSLGQAVWEAGAPQPSALSRNPAPTPDAVPPWSVIAASSLRAIYVKWDSMESSGLMPHTDTGPLGVSRKCHCYNLSLLPDPGLCQKTGIRSLCCRHGRKMLSPGAWMAVTNWVILVASKVGCCSSFLTPQLSREDTPSCRDKGSCCVASDIAPK